MSSLNELVRRFLLEYITRNEVSFHTLASRINVVEDKIILWVSGNHDFTLNEISLIETGLQFKLVTFSENDSNNKLTLNAILDQVIQKSLFNYSVRFQNVIKKLHKDCKDPVLFYIKLDNVLERNMSLPNAGKSTLKELEHFRNHLTEKGFQIEEKASENHDYIDIFRNRYKLSEAISFRYSKRIEDHEPFIFKLLDDIFNHSKLYKETQRGTLIIFTNNANDGKVMPLAEAADLLNVTKERVRQLKLKIEDEIVDLGKGFRSIFGATKLMDQYPLLFQPVHLAIDLKLSSLINTTENVKFSIKTCALLIKGLKFPDAELLKFKSNTIYIVP